MLTDIDIQSNRERIIALLSKVRRKGMGNVLTYLEESGFYTAPSSVDGHHNWKGGLAQHSLNVYLQAAEWAPELPQDSLIITGLLHDICKASLLYYDENGEVRHRDPQIKGHGYRSNRLLEICLLEVTEEERRVIRWHMGGPNAQPGEIDEVNETKATKLWQVINKADTCDARNGY